MRIYLAGPMRGVEKWNFPAFAEAAERWRQAGHYVITPAELDRAIGLNPDKPEQLTPEATRLCMRLDIDVIFSVDAIALLPGWRKSTGATAEVALALFLGLETYSAETMRKIYPDPHPWESSL